MEGVACIALLWWCFGAGIDIVIVVSPMQRPLPRREFECCAVFMFCGVFTYSVCSINLFLHTVLVVSVQSFRGLMFKQILRCRMLRPQAA